MLFIAFYCDIKRGDKVYVDIDACSVRCKRVTVTVPDNSESVGTQTRHSDIHRWSKWW